MPWRCAGPGGALLSDNGCQPTARAFMQACSAWGLQQACTSDNNPHGHADTERVMRTLKEECLWLQEWTSPLALARALDVWSTDAHEHSLHSALGYQSPSQVGRQYYLSHETPFAAA